MIWNPSVMKKTTKWRVGLANMPLLQQTSLLLYHGLFSYCSNVSASVLIHSCADTLDSKGTCLVPLLLDRGVPAVATLCCSLSLIALSCLVLSLAL